MSRSAASVESEQPAPSADGTFEPVQLATLQVERCYDFDLYLKTEQAFSLYRARHAPFSEADRQRLVANGLEVLFVRASDRMAYRKYLVGQLEGIVTDERLPVQQRCEVTARCARELARELFSDPGELQLYEDTGRLVRSTTTLVLREPDAVVGLAKMLRHDYYTSTHLINVSTLSLLLALRLGIRDEARLCRIGMGGLLHDIGKARIDPAILNSPRRLTDREMSEMRRHPDYGMMIMMEMETPEVGREVLRMIHQHHERLDGSGYPVGLCGEEIASCSRICAVVDVYDAMTCKRPYRDALPVQVALEHLVSQSGDRLDSEIVSAWLEIAPTLGEQQLAGIDDEPAGDDGEGSDEAIAAQKAADV